MDIKEEASMGMASMAVKSPCCQLHITNPTAAGTTLSAAIRCESRLSLVIRCLFLTRVMINYLLKEMVLLESNQNVFNFNNKSQGHQNILSPKVRCGINFH